MKISSQHSSSMLVYIYLSVCPSPSLENQCASAMLQNFFFSVTFTFMPDQRLDGKNSAPSLDHRLWHNVKAFASH